MPLPLPKSNNAEVQHIKTIHMLQSIRKVQEIVDNAKTLTAEAIARYTGAKPTMTESRAFEASLSMVHRQILQPLKNRNHEA